MATGNLGPLLKRARQKKIASGPSKGVYKTAAVGGARAAYGESGHGAEQAAKSHQRDKERIDMQRKMIKYRRVNSSAEKMEEQEKKNAKLAAKVRWELSEAKLTHTRPDMGTISDYLQDYVPVRNKKQK